jgi:hypothetical protein
MSGELEVRESETLVVPGTSEVVDLSDPVAAAMALDALREFENAVLAPAKRLLTDAVLSHYRLTGERTLELPNRLKAEVKAGTRTIVDPDLLETRLREAGMPDERIEQLITTTQERKVDLRKAKSAATANEAYKTALEAASTTYQETPSVTIRRR